MIDISTDRAMPPEDPLYHVEQNVQAEVGELSQRLKDTKATHNFLNELLSYRDKNWKIHIKLLCEKRAHLLRGLREREHPCVPIVEALYRDAKEYSNELSYTIPVSIERLADERQISIDRKSRHPRYFLSQHGFIDIYVDDQKLKTTILTREGTLASLASDPEAIFEVIQKEEKRLFARKFDGEKFLKDLRKGYQKCIKKNNSAQYGDSVSIRDLYECLKKGNYQKDEFLVDLSNLVQNGPAEIEGERFDIQQTKDTRSGILLLGAAGQGMVNLIVFRKVTGDANE